jgi:hypothetical protein
LPVGFRTDSLASQACTIARISTNTAIPVYLSDGKTVVGEFVIGQ